MLNTKSNRIATAAVIVMSSMVLSRFTGFIRETMLSWKVGLSWVQDAYIAAFAVPDLMYTLLVGGTISAALVPFLSGKLETGEEEEGWRAASSFINSIIISLACLCLLGVVFAPQIIPVIAPGFSQKSPQTRELAIQLSRILFPSVSFIMLAGICNGVLNSYRKFAAAAYGPSLYNIGCALSIYLFAETNPQSMKKVAWGVALSAFVYFLVQLSFAFRRFKLFRFKIELRDSGFKKLINQAVPSLMASSVTQLNILISTAFVSLSSSEGGLAAFRNANTTWQLPYGIFAMGLGTAILPTLSGKFASRELEDYIRILKKSLTSVLFVAIPSAVGFILLREPIIRAIFSWGGKFGEEDVPYVATILAMFSVSMISQSAAAILNRAFYAMQDTKTPLLIGIGATFMNITFGIVFYRFTSLGAAGMALSYSIISTVNSVLLLLLIKRRIKELKLNELLGFVAKAGVSALIMGILVAFLQRVPVSLDTKVLQLSYLALEIGAGAAVYFAIMWLLKIKK